MHKDTKEALARLEQELLSSGQTRISDDELDLLIEDILLEEEAPEDIPPRRVYNADKTDPDLELYSDEVYTEPEDKKTAELWFTLLILALTVGVMVWWAVSIL